MLHGLFEFRKNNILNFHLLIPLKCTLEISKAAHPSHKNGETARAQFSILGPRGIGHIALMWYLHFSPLKLVEKWSDGGARGVEIFRVVFFILIANESGSMS